MFRIDSLTAVAVKPAYPPIGVAGYFTETPPPTELTGHWFNHVQEELCGVIVAAGLALDKADDTLLAQAISGAAAVKSHAADTGVVTTLHRRAVVAGTGCRATGDMSAAVASGAVVVSGIASGSLGCISLTVSGANAAAIATAGSGAAAASGAQSALVASEGPSIASGVDSAVIGCECGIASGERSVLIASTNAELNTAHCIGGGVGAAPIAPGAANQNITWWVQEDGDAQFATAKLVSPATSNTHFEVNGATVDVKNPADGVLHAQIDQVTGDIDCDGYLNSGGKITGADLEITGGDFTVTAAGRASAADGYAVTAGAGKCAEVNAGLWAAGLAAGSNVTAIANAKVAATSIVLWAFEFSNPPAPGGPLVAGQCVVTAGNVTFDVVNLAGVATAVGTLTIRYLVINPA